MITRLSLVTILVSDQEDAASLVHRNAGVEETSGHHLWKRSRWLVVAPSHQADFGIVLQKPEPGLHGEEDSRRLMEQIGKGTTWIFHADDLNATYEILKSKGVKFDSPPTRQAWGNQAMFEDPYGNRYTLMGKQRSGDRGFAQTEQHVFTHVLARGGCQ